MNSDSGEQGSGGWKGSPPPPSFPPAETLRRSNLALRQRCEEMEGWQRRTREDREFLSCRFQEARALVERLAEENHSLRGLVNGPISSSSSSSSQTEELQGPPLRKGPADGAQVSHVMSHLLRMFLPNVSRLLSADSGAERQEENGGNRSVHTDHAPPQFGKMEGWSSSMAQSVFHLLAVGELG